MPIPTSSDAWQTAERNLNARDHLLSFLRDHSGQAFHAYELADEVMNAGWGRFFEEERLIQSVGEEEYYENLEEYEEQLPGESRGGGAGGAELRYIQKCLMDLEDTGEIEVRDVLISDLDIPVEEWNVVDCYTYIGDSDSSSGL